MVDSRRLMADSGGTQPFTQHEMRAWHVFYWHLVLVKVHTYLRRIKAHATTRAASPQLVCGKVTFPLRSCAARGLALRPPSNEPLVKHINIGAFRSASKCFRHCTHDRAT